MEMDYEQLLMGIANNVRARAPYKTGNLKSKIRFLATPTVGDVFGKLEIDVDYATFVNYGYTKHPNSRKLRKDYLFVEKGIRNELRSVVNKYGGGYVK